MNANKLKQEIWTPSNVAAQQHYHPQSGGMFNRAFGEKAWYPALSASSDCDKVLLAIGRSIAEGDSSFRDLPDDLLQCAAVLLLCGRMPRLMRNGKQVGVNDKEAGGRGFGFLPLTDCYTRAIEAGFKASNDCYTQEIGVGNSDYQQSFTPAHFLLGVQRSRDGGNRGDRWYDWAERKASENHAVEKKEKENNDTYLKNELASIKKELEEIAKTVFGGRVNSIKLFDFYEEHSSKEQRELPPNWRELIIKELEEC